MYFHRIMWTFQTKNNFKHMNILDTLHIYSRVHKTLRLALEDFTLDSESEVYFQNIPQRKPAQLYKCPRAAQSFTG